jgi:2-polyprenyl-3-methyl-5-hydroxy-6-metoxy-1,4-benzoquinol methylase
MLRERSTAEEWMDDAAATEPYFAGALRDLARVNRLTFALRPTLRWLDRLARATGARRLSILDVGAGGGDMLRAIARWGERRGIAVALTGLDRSPWAAPHAAASGTPGEFLTGDLFTLDPARRFDVVLCSQLAHHLPDPELVRFLGWMEDRARLGWMISDIHRHWFAWAFAWGLTRAMRCHPMVVHDSTISVARSFVRTDWERLLAQAGIGAEIRWVFPFRWAVGRIRA